MMHKKFLISMISLLGVFAIYAALSIVYFGLGIGFHLQARMIGLAGGHDQVSYIWEIYWWIYAIIHHLNPAFTRYIFYPYGQNTLWSQTVPASALLSAPITLLWGPVATYNILTIFASAFSAFTAFILIKYITRSFKTSLFAAYFYGFSTYQIAQLIHLSLVLTFVVPLLVYVALKFWNKEITPRTYILLAACLLSLQFLLSSEILATFTIFGGVAIIVIWCLFKDLRNEMQSFIFYTILSYCGMAILLSPVLYSVFRHGLPPKVAADNSPVSNATDLLNFFIPTGVTWFGKGTFSRLSSMFVPGLIESNGYIGVPLLGLVITFFFRYRKQKLILLLAIMLSIVVIATLGAVLHIAGISTVKPLPWKIVEYLPLIGQALPVRFMLYVFLIISIVVGLWLEHREINVYIRYGLVLLGVFFLFPNLSYTNAYTPTAIPAFFQSGLYRSYLSKGENVLFLPYAGYSNAMLWQAYTNMYFTMPEGYIGPWGTSPKPFLQDPVPAAIAFRSTNLQDPHMVAITRAQWEHFVSTFRVQAVIIDKSYFSYFKPISVWLPKGKAVGNLVVYKL